MRLRIILAGAMLTMGGCEAGNDNQSAENRGPTTTTAIAEPAAPPADCSKLPDFVPLYADARIKTCVSGPAGEPHRESGTVIYTTGATPEAIVAWYKDKAVLDGLAPALSTPSLFSARDGGKRSIMAVVETARGATKVTLNWAGISDLLYVGLGRPALLERDRDGLVMNRPVVGMHLRRPQAGASPRGDLRSARPLG